MSNLAERTRTRRGQLIEAGIPLIGLPHGRPVGVREVCKAAGLTERYFYQAFGSREQYVRAVFYHVAISAREAYVSALRPDMTVEERARTAVEIFMIELIDNPAKGRVVFVGPTTEPVLGPYSAEYGVEFVRFVRGNLSSTTLGEVERRLRALSIVGALSALFTAYLHQYTGATREQFIEHCVEVALAGSTAREPA